MPQKHRWASAATPAQRNTIHPQEPPRKVSDLINPTPLLGKDNPRWPIGNATETIRLPDVGSPDPRGPSPAITEAIRTATGLAASWLAGLPRRAGNRLFARNDAEARWRGWQVTELAGGLARQYRDPRFDSVSPEGRPPEDPPGSPEYESWLSGPIPGVPEAWDDHWNGCDLGGGA
jgi:hypothetical protein